MARGLGSLQNKGVVSHINSLSLRFLLCRPGMIIISCFIDSKMSSIVQYTIFFVLYAKKEKTLSIQV